MGNSFVREVSSEKEVTLILDNNKYDRFFTYVKDNTGNDVPTINKLLLKIFLYDIVYKYDFRGNKGYSTSLVFDMNKPINKIKISVDESIRDNRRGTVDSRYGNYEIVFESQFQKTITIRYVDGVFNKSRLNQIVADVKKLISMADSVFLERLKSMAVSQVVNEKIPIGPEGQHAVSNIIRGYAGLPTRKAGIRKNRKQKHRSRKVKKTRKH